MTFETDASLTEKLYFVNRWELARRYASLLRSKAWTEGLTRPTVDDFVEWVNRQAEVEYDRKTLMTMIDVFNAYSPIGGKIAVSVREMGFIKAGAAIPWVERHKGDPDKLAAIFAICRDTSEKKLRAQLAATFPLRG